MKNEPHYLASVLYPSLDPLLRPKVGKPLIGYTMISPSLKITMKANPCETEYRGKVVPQGML